MNNSPVNHTQQHTSEENIDLKRIFVKLIDKWPWFIISVFLCVLLAWTYAYYTAPIYRIKASLLVSDNDKSGGLGGASAGLMDLGGLMGAKSSVDNEAMILKTRFLMEQVVRQMQLNIVYGKKANFISRELYESPFHLNIIKGTDSISPTKITVTKLENNKLKVVSKDFNEDLSWNQSFTIKGVGVVQLNPEAGKVLTSGEYFVNINSIDKRVSELMDQLIVAVSNKQVSIIDLGLTYPVQKKGEDILNTLINKYTAANLGDKNAIADSTYKFIRERLNVIASELGDVEDKVQNFKQKNNLADMTEQGKLLVQSSGEFSSELAKSETQVTILNDLEDYLKDETKNKRVFPSTLLPSDMVFSGLMNQYNALLVERDKQLLSVTEESPFIQNIDTQILSLRKGILANIQNTKNTFVVSRDKLRKQVSAAQDQIGGVPQIEKNYLKLARNQQIKQELYIFLMQKAEETAISKTSNISIAKTIDPPKAEFAAISPNKGIVYLIGLLAGLVIPAVLFFIKEVLNTKIITKEDVTAHTVVPVIGEISRNTGSDDMIVANQGRSAISEQYRALRTNLSFYLKTDRQKIILMTSSLSGEGKSFTAINLANVFALAGKKVLLMELDLRKPGLSGKLGISNSTGFSNYTINATTKAEDIIVPLSINKNMFIIPSGPLPPNPAETLMSERTDQLMAELKEMFDYIIMDAPPIGIITDAQLLSKYSDVVIYLVRQNYTEKAKLSIVEDLYRTDKMKNLGIVVNDIVNKSYGYGYGYGEYGQVQEATGFRKLLKMFKN